MIQYGDVVKLGANAQELHDVISYSTIDPAEPYARVTIVQRSTRKTRNVRASRVVVVHRSSGSTLRAADDPEHHAERYSPELMPGSTEPES